MFNLGLKSAARSVANLRIPGFDDLTSLPKAGAEKFGDVAQGATEKFGKTVSTLLSQVKEHAPAIGRPDFGGPGIGKFASPLIDFLGGVSPTAPLGSLGDAPKGERIPGGKAIYLNGMFHKGAPGAPDTYAFENSPAGIEFAAKNGYSSIDIDMQITKDGVPVATHWAKPLEKDGFYDPQGKIKEGTKVSEMTLQEVMRLRNEDGQSQIYPMSTMIKELKKHGIAGDLEAKDDNRFASDEMMGQLADMVRESGIKANLKTINRGERSEKIVDAAQDHGFYVKIALPKDGEKKYRGYGG